MIRAQIVVMPREEILDPQGEAVANALQALGFSGVTKVRQGKIFEVVIEASHENNVLASLEEAAQDLLTNPVTEEYVIKIIKEEK